MNTVSSRDLKNNPGILSDSDVTLVLSRSKPMALCVSVSEGEDVISLADTILRMRAQTALEKARLKARSKGIEMIGEEEIEKEILSQRNYRGKEKKDV